MTEGYKRTRGWDWGVLLLWVLVLVLLLLSDSVSPLGNGGNYSQFYIPWEPWKNLQHADTDAVVSQPQHSNAPVVANISPSAAILHLWSLHNAGELAYELTSVFQPVQSPLKTNLMEKIQNITLLRFILLLPEGLGTHTHF